MDINRNILPDSARLRDVMQLLNAGVNGIALVVNADGRLIGIFTDGDVRRALLAGANPDENAADYMNRNFTSVSASEGRQAALTRMSENCRHLPLLDDNGRPVDLVSWSELWRIGVSAPHLGGNEMKYVDDCLVNGWISSQGHYVQQFEEALADYLGVSHAVATSSGTTALHLSMAALGITGEDEVILPNITFGASANTVIQCGARPVFVDVDAATWTLDIDKLAGAVTPRTRAIMPVHIYGHPCDMDPILEFAREHDLYVIEDCAEAFGAKYRGRKVGGLGDVGCFSFFANKVITTGEGGVVVTNDAALADKLRLLCNHGMDPQRRYWHLVPGFNYRMTNLQAAVGLAQLERVDKFLTRRRELAGIYDRELSEIAGLYRRVSQSWAEPICWLYTILVDESVLPFDRDDLIRRLSMEGIDSRPLFPPLNLQPAYGNEKAGAYPVSELIAERGLSLPTSNAMTADEAERIGRTIARVIANGRIYADAESPGRLGGMGKREGV